MTILSGSDFSNMHALHVQVPECNCPQCQALDPVAAFLANGGEVQAIPTGERAMSESEHYRAARDSVCDCGCEGNYTDHTMRKGERGQA